MNNIMNNKMIKQVRVGSSINGKIVNLIVTVPMKSGIKVGDYVKIEKVEI